VTHSVSLFYFIFTLKDNFINKSLTKLIAKTAKMQRGIVSLIHIQSKL